MGVDQFLFRKFQCIVQGIHKFIDLDGFGEIAEESCLQSFLDIAGHGIGTEGNDGDMRRCRVFAQDFQRLDSADAGQIDVHQDHIREMGARKRYAEIAIARAQHAYMWVALNYLLDQHQVGRIVFHIEQGAQRRVFLELAA